jgi:hypothetical protein
MRFATASIVVPDPLRHPLAYYNTMNSRALIKSADKGARIRPFSLKSAPAWA